MVWGKNSGEPATGSLMHAGSEGWPVWSNPTDKLLLLKLLKKLMLVLIERCQNIQCITVCCVWGCIAADQSGCPCWPPKIKQWAHAHQNWTSVQWKKVACLMNNFSLTSRGWQVASLTWGTHGIRMHYGKKARRRRQCNALDNVLLGNLESCGPCGGDSDMSHLPTSALLQTMNTLSWKQYSLMSVASFSRIICHKAKKGSERF